MEIMRRLMMLAESVEFDEGVSISDPVHFGAYAITVAEAYDAAPVHDAKTTHIWQELARHNEEVMLKKIKSTGINVKYTAEDPYGVYASEPIMQVRFMLWDMVVNNQLLIYTGYSDNHPVFNERQNIIFRTVHDYYSHGKLRSIFKHQIQTMGLEHSRPSPQELQRILPNIRLDVMGNIGHSFTIRGEMNSYLTHSRLAPPQIAPAIFTEIVGQACYFVVADDFPVQKASFLQGFDYQHVGLTIPGSRVDIRMQELIKLLPKTDVIATNVAAKPKIPVAKLLDDLATR